MDLKAKPNSRLATNGHLAQNRTWKVTCGVSYSRVLTSSSPSRASARDKGSWHRTAHQKGERTLCFYSSNSHVTFSASLSVSTSIQSRYCNGGHAPLSPHTQRRQRKELCRQPEAHKALIHFIVMDNTQKAHKSKNRKPHWLHRSMQ